MAENTRGEELRFVLNQIEFYYNLAHENSTGVVKEALDEYPMRPYFNTLRNHLAEIQ